jgi:hypothetical protein
MSKLAPTPEQLANIVNSGVEFFVQVSEAAKVHGVEPPPLTAVALAIRRANLHFRWSEWERAMNPCRQPFGDDGVGVRGWPDGMRLAQALCDLYSIRKEIVQHWGLEAAIGFDGPVSYASGPAEENEDAPVPSASRLHLVKPLGWPPPIPLDWLRQAWCSLQQIAELVEREQASRRGEGHHPTDQNQQAAPSAAGPNTEVAPALLGGDHQRQGTPPAAGVVERKQKQTLALACLLRIGPNATRIAREVGVPRGTLLGWPEFRQYYDQMKIDQQAARESRGRGRRAGKRDFEVDAH